VPRVVIERLMDGVSEERVWEHASRLADYPRFMDQVLDVSEVVVEGVDRATSWIVLLNGNELRWVEEDVYDHANRRLSFQQIDGDLAEWRGRFEVRKEGAAVLACYDVEFDLGVPALAEVLHPLGEVAIRSNCAQMLEELDARSRLTRSADA
jgi:hypothetical protein